MTTLTETAPPQTSPQTQPAPRVRRKRRWSAALIYAVVIIWSLISLFPALFAVSSSFKLKRDVLQPLNFIFTPTLNNYTDLFVENHMGGYIQNNQYVQGVNWSDVGLALLWTVGITAVFAPLAVRAYRKKVG